MVAKGDYKSRSDLWDHFIRRSKCPCNPWLSSGLAAPQLRLNPRFIIALGSAELPDPGTSRAANEAPVPAAAWPMLCPLSGQGLRHRVTTIPWLPGSAL